VDMFDVPYELTYRAVSEGQFKRFTQSMTFLKMLADPAATEAASLRDAHRRRHSFALVPAEEEYRFVGEVMHKLARSDVPKDKRHHLKLFPQSFKGNRLVDWFIEVGFAKSRPAGMALGQRLYDLLLIRHVRSRLLSPALWTVLCGPIASVDAVGLRVDESARSTVLVLD
jgi:hypothetical protein